MRSRNLFRFLTPAAMLLLLAVAVPDLYGQRGQGRGRGNGDRKHGASGHGHRGDPRGGQQRQAPPVARRQAEPQQHFQMQRRILQQQHENARRQQVQAQRQQHENARRQQQIYVQRQQQQQQAYRQQWENARQRQESAQRQQRRAHQLQQQNLQRQQAFAQQMQRQQTQNAYRQQWNAQRQQRLYAGQMRQARREQERSVRDSRRFYQRQVRPARQGYWPQTHQRWTASRLERQNRSVETQMRREQRAQQRLARRVWAPGYYRPQNAIVNATYPLVYQQIYTDPNRGRWFNGYREYRRELRAMRRAERRLARQQQRWADYGYPQYSEFYPSVTGYYYQEGYTDDNWGYVKENFLRSVISNAFSDNYYAPIQTVTYYSEPIYTGADLTQYGYGSYDPYYDPYDGYAGDYRAAPMYIGNGSGFEPSQILEVVGAIAAPLLKDTGTGGVVSRIFSELLATGYDEGYVAGQYAREQGYVDDGAFYDPYDPYVYEDVSFENRSYNPYSCLGENRMYLSEGYELGYQDGVRDAQRQAGFDQNGAVDLVSVLLGNII